MEHLGFHLATSSEPVHLVGSFRQRYIGRALAPVFCMPATREVYAVKNLDVYGSLTIDGFGATKIRHNQHWPNVEEKQPYAQFTDSNPTAIIATAITVCIDLYTASVEGDGWDCILRQWSAHHRRLPRVKWSLKGRVAVLLAANFGMTLRMYRLT